MTPTSDWRVEADAEKTPLVFRLTTNPPKPLLTLRADKKIEVHAHEYDLPGFIHFLEQGLKVVGAALGVCLLVACGGPSEKWLEMEARCAAPEVCGLYGACALQDIDADGFPLCVPRNDKDCEDSAVCLYYGRCHKTQLTGLDFPTCAPTTQVDCDRSRYCNGCQNWTLPPWPAPAGKPCPKVCAVGWGDCVGVP